MAGDVGLIASTGGMFKSGMTTIGTTYGWLLWTFVALAVVVIAGIIIKMLFDKKKQWTHTLEYRRVLPTGYLSKIQTIRMRRFPLITRAEVFLLETALLGGYLISELDSYTDLNSFSIIIDKSNRIYKNTGEKFDPHTSSVIVSAKHAEIDLARAELKAKYQNINSVSQGADWAKIAKFALIGLIIIAAMIVAIKGIGAWGESQEANAAQAQAEAQTWIAIEDVMTNIEANKNTNLLLADKLNQLYGTNNIQAVVREAKS